MNIHSNWGLIYEGVSDLYISVERYKLLSVLFYDMKFDFIPYIIRTMDTDYIDLKIIKALADNARTSMAELARVLKLSPPTVAERVKRLEEAGIITGYSVAIDYEALGFPVAAWIRIRAVPGELKRVSDIIKSRPEIVYCDRITGEDCFIARAYVRKQADLEALLDELIPYAMTNTSIIQSSPVSPRLRGLSKQP